MYLKNPLYKQQGMTMVSWMIVIGIALFFVMIGLKMVPSYMEFYSIKQVLTGVSEDRTLRKKSRGEIRKLIMKRLKINGVYEFNKDNLAFKKIKEGMELSVDYEVRKPVAGNVTIMMHFQHKVDLPR